MFERAAQISPRGMKRREQAEARQTEAIQLKFEAEPGERFSVQVSWRDRTLTEVFQV